MLFVINPISAGGRTLRTWETARRELLRLRLSFTERVTTRPGEAVEMTRHALRDGNDAVIAVGGDGTLNEVINGYFDPAGTAVNPSACIGLLPSGTGSDFKRSIGLANGVEALDALVRSRPRRIDVARVEFPDAARSRYLVNLASFGLGGEAIALINGWRNAWPRFIGGRARYTAAALLALGKHRNAPVALRFDDEVTAHIQSGFFVVANGRFAGGGMMFAPHADLEDGLLDIVMTDRTARWEIVRELPGIQRGDYLRRPKVSSRRARTVEIRSETPLAVDIDGEFAGYTPARLTVFPKAVRFLMKADM